MAITRLDIPSLETLRDRFCRDVRRGKQRAGITNPNIAPGSETYIKGEAVASVALQIMAREVLVQDATMPDRATGDDLVRLAKVLRDIDQSMGAGAQGNVIADCVGSATYPVGLECRTADGLRYQVVTSTIAADGDPIPVRGIDVGTRTDKIAGTVLTWTSPPVGSNVTTVVGPGGLTAGADPDNDPRLRARLIDALRHPAESGAWAHYVKWTEQASTAVEKGYCYCAPQGPGTVHIVFTVAADAENAYTRAGSTALVNSVAISVCGSHPEHADLTTTTVIDYDTNVILELQLPEHEADGGPGGSWLDPLATRWPLAQTTPFASYVVSVSSPTIIRVNCLNVGTNAPVTASHSKIAIWSNLEKKFYHTQIKTATFISGTQYDLELYTAIDTSAIAANDYISPDAVKLDDYGKLVAEMFGGLGPGEITFSSLVLPRALRHPLQSEDWNCALTSSHIGRLSTSYPEIRHVATLSPTLPYSPPLAAGVTLPPKLLRCGKLALYPYL